MTPDELAKVAADVPLVRIERMILEEQAMLYGLTLAYEAKVINYAHFSPAWDNAACRVEGLKALGQAVAGWIRENEQ